MSVESRCPRLEWCGGVNPSNPPHRRTAAGGDGLRPAGLMLRGRKLQNQASVSFETSSTANAVPLLLQGEGLNALERGQDLQCPATRQRFACRRLRRGVKTRTAGGITSSTATAVPLLLQGEGLNALKEEQDLQCPATRQRFARRFSEVSRPTSKVKPHCKRHIVLPLEGKGDRSAVDEVTCNLAPLRGASKTAPDIGRLFPISGAIY